MRFNDYHKDVCRALGFTEDEQRREIRTDCMKCYAQHLSPVAAVGVIRMILASQQEQEAIEAKKRGLA
jgi:hypothetical protein